jgi:hypothetical protein
MLSERLNVENFYISAFEQASISFENSNKTIIKDIVLAGLSIRLKFAGDALVPLLMPAISHLLVKDSIKAKPDYEIDIWDSESTNCEFPRSPCSKDDISWRGEIKNLISSRFETAYFAHARMLTLLDHESSKGVVCFASSKNIPSFELTCPFRGVFSWILRRNNTTLLHAGAVGTNNGTVLIGGNSGAGKSSTAFRCLMGGLNYLGDDICALSSNDGIPLIHSVYSSGKTLTKDLSNFPEFFQSIYGNKESSYEKEIFFFNEYFSQNLQLSGELKAVIIPFQNTSLELGFKKMSFAKALSVISSSTKSLLPDAGNESFKIVSSVLHRVPCFQFNLGNDPQKIASSVAEFIIQLKNDTATI